MLLDYFTIGAGVSLLMYYCGVCEKIGIFYNLLGEDISEEEIVLSTIITGVFLWPVLVIFIVLDELM